MGHVWSVVRYGPGTTNASIVLTTAVASVIVVSSGLTATLRADESAIRRMQSLGADITQYPASNAEPGFTEVRFRKWRGRPSDYALLKKIPNVTLLDMTSIELHDDDVETLSGVKSVKHLELGRTSIGDSALKRLGKMEQLMSLSLSENPITDDGVKELAQLKNLTQLDLSRTRVKGHTLMFLPKGLRSLNLSGDALDDLRLSRKNATCAIEVLQLHNSGARDELLAHLDKCPNLANLDLSHCRVTDAGLRHVGKLAKLGMLRLDRLDITDKGLSHLRNLQELRFLTMQGAARVTDEGLAHLSGLKKLQGVLVVGTKITRNGVQELERHLGHGLGETGVK